MKSFFPALLGLCLTAVCSAQDAALPKALIPDPRPEPGCAELHRSFNEISKKGEAQLVFLGDSITQGWGGAGKAAWDSTWAPLKAANFGIGGDRTEHVLWRLEHGNFDGLKPKLTVLMIGTNNSGHRMDPAADTAAGVKAIVEKLQAKQPQMKILLLGVFPRGEKPTDAYRVRTNEINALISKQADGTKVTYMDLSPEFVQADGTISKEIMPDFLHLSPKGYDLWTAAIAPKVKELMKD